MIVLSFSHPPPGLHPNRRWKNRYGLSRVTDKRRGDSEAVTRSALGRKDAPRWGSATVQAHWYFKANRLHDDDNLIAWLKSTCDGIADAGIVANDRGFTHLKPIVGVDAKDPRVVLTITPT